MHPFADDAKCSNHVRKMEDCDQLQLYLNRLSDWSLEWKLKFKAVKCAYLSFCNRDPPIEASCTINNSTLNVKLVHKDLGVITSSNLSWSCHYDHLALHAYRTIHLPCQTFKFAESTSAKKTLYLTLIRTKLFIAQR